MSTAEKNAAPLSPSVDSLSSAVDETWSLEGYAPLDFDSDGEWDEINQIGPVIHAPDYIKNIIIKCYRIEWLNLSDPKNSFYTKNHMVATLIFAKAVMINGIEYGSARLSMELGKEKTVVEIAGQDGWIPGQNYFPGVYMLNMLNYNTPTSRATHLITFPVLAGSRISNFTNMILQLKMHHFLFLPYTVEGRWKGCGDHTLHCWAHFVRQGIITTDQPMEPGARPLPEEIVYTYLTPTNKMHERIGRGWWVSYNPLEDVYAPETTFTDRRPRYLLPKSNEGVNVNTNDED